MTIEAPDDVRLSTADEGEAPAPRVEDIYSLLGVRPDASRTLAREMYWSRIQPLLDPGRRDDPSIRASIEALNDALATITDDDRRAAYDTRSGIEERRQHESRSQRRHEWLAQGFWFALLTAGFSAALVLLAATSSWQFAIAASTVVPTVRVVSGQVERWRRPRTGSLGRLGLLDGASRDDVDLAYRTKAQELLLRLRTDEHALANLNRLDHDYLSAMRAVMGLDGPHAVPAAPTASAAVEPVSRQAPAQRDRASEIGRFLGARTRDAARSFRQHAARIELPARAPQTPRAPRPPRPSVDPVALVDLEQRLAASLKANTLEVARNVPVVEHGATGVVAPPRVAAFLLLSSSVGVRRVPIQDRPLRIGSGASCDLVLPARDQVLGEHALVWRHGDAVVLHVTDPDAECQVNGHASSWATLEDGDELAVGLVRLQIEIQRTDG